MKIAALVIGSFLALVFQNTVFNVISVAGGKPDFLLIFVVFFSIFRGSVPGGLLGLLLGIMEDLMIGRFIGINAVCKGLIGFFIGMAERRLYKDNFLLPIVALVIATFVNAAMYCIFSNMIGSVITIPSMLSVAIPNSIYNMCFAPLIYAMFYKIYYWGRNEE